MELQIELNKQQINTVKDIFSDGVITDEERKKAEKDSISIELMNALQGKSPDEINKLPDKANENNPENSTPWYKKLITGVLGAIAGTLSAMVFFKGTKVKLIGGIIGAGIALIADKWLGSKKKEEIPITHNRVKCKAKVTPAFTYTAQPDDNFSKIAKNQNISLSRLRKANSHTDENKIQIGQKINIPESYSIDGLEIKPSFISASEYSGASAIYLQDIINGLECKNKGPKLKAYYDGVKDEKHPKGYLTIGFGHTGNINGKKITEKTKITKDQAYRLLAYDILSARAEAITFLGEGFLKAPQSIQDAIIDIAYNKTSEKVFDGIERDNKGNIINDNFISETRKLKDDLANGDYISAAKHVIYNTKNLGLQKRNIYRVITAVRDLPHEQRAEVLNAIEPYYIKIKTKLNKNYPKDANMMQKSWEAAHNGICYNFFN